MKPENAIEVHNITKKFKVYLDKGHTLKERTLFSKRRKFENREVLIVGLLHFLLAVVHNVLGLTESKEHIIYSGHAVPLHG